MLAQHLLRWNEGNRKMSHRLWRRSRLKHGRMSVLLCVVLFCVFSGIIVDLSAMKGAVQKMSLRIHIFGINTESKEDKELKL
jgi:hypothetical protein